MRLPNDSHRLIRLQIRNGLIVANGSFLPEPTPKVKRFWFHNGETRIDSVRRIRITRDDTFVVDERIQDIFETEYTYVVQTMNLT